MSGEERWYALQTQSRHENRVRRLIQQEIDEEMERIKVRIKARKEAAGTEPDIREVLVPTHEVVEIRKGKRVPVTKPVYPGYLLVRMVLNEESEHVIAGMKGVRFVTHGDDPQPLSREDVNRIRGVEAEDEPGVRDEIPFRPGQAVEVIQGPFTEFSGTVQEVYADKGKVKVEVSLFGRPTSVELDFTQLKGF